MIRPESLTPTLIGTSPSRIGTRTRLTLHHFHKH
jgi:hypothetical protein